MQVRVRWLDWQVSTAGIAVVKPTGMYLRRPAKQATGLSRSQNFISRGDESFFMIVKMRKISAATVAMAMKIVKIFHKIRAQLML